MSAVLRMSIAGVTDNFAQGGIAVGIDIEKGSLKKVAKDKYGNRYFKHPKTNWAFDEARLPFWNEIIETVIKAAKVLSEVRLIGWDIALTDEGPLILEANRKSDFYLSQSQGQVFFDSAYVHENMIK